MANNIVIKVCGITLVKQLHQLEALNIDYAGLIFYPESPRYVGKNLDKEEIKGADFDLRKVGVFKNPALIDVLTAIDDYGLDAVQLSGNESAEMCEDISSEVEVIKVFAIDDTVKSIENLIEPYDAACDYYLFEHKGDSPDGNGKQFDWNILKKTKIEKPFFISGGIGPDSVEAIKKFNHPDFLGVDINSQFEKEPGIKDMAKLLQFKMNFK